MHVGPSESETTLDKQHSRFFCALHALASLSRRLPSTLLFIWCSPFPLPGLALLFVVGTFGRHSMGSEDEAEQSVKRANSGSLCLARTPRAANSPRPSSPAGTSLLKLVLQLSGSCGPRTPAELGLFDPHAVQNDCQLASNSDCCF